MSYTGTTITITIIDSVSRQPVSGATVDLYIYGAYVSSDVIIGTKATPISGDTGVTGITTDRQGVAYLTNVAPGSYCVIVRGASINPQIPAEYNLIQIPNLIRGHPDYMKMQDLSGVAWYVSVTTGGTLSISASLA